MSVTPVPPELQQLAARLNTIIHELEGLRRQLTAPAAQTEPLPSGFVDRLYGAAGTGSRGEYDPHLDWSRFAE